jgi:acyl-[acyl-carrier-protein]-phospholipid O-acyltransferase/long-chain-fatty-acid--[acyl-carrier-protein] ligase
VPETAISAANGITALFTMLACLSGQIVGGYVFFWTTWYENKVPTDIPGGHHVWITALALVGMAAVGLASSFFIPSMNAVDPQAKFPRKPFRQIGKDLAALFSHRALFWVAIASAFYWGIAALAQNNIDKYASEYLMVQQQHVTLLAAVLIIGIGVGAVFCGYLSGKRIELGLVPIGACGLGFFILILGFTPSHAGTVARGYGSPLDAPYLFGAIVMVLAGLGAGLYDIPLAAYLQKKSPTAQRGRMIAAYNFCTFSAMLLFTGLGLFGAVIFGKLGLDGGQASLMIWIAAGLMTLAVAAILFYFYAAPCMIFFFRILTRIVYRPKSVGIENVPAEGPALLVCNHVSYLDGFMLFFACPRTVRYVAHQDMIPSVFECCVRETKIIKILPGSPKSVIQAIRAAREALRNGEVVGIMPEGGITRNGQMKAFEPGFMSMLKGVTTPDGKPVPVIPCHIGGLHESMFGYKYGDKKTILRPRKLVTDVIVSFGKPMYDVKCPLQVQLAVQELGVDSHREYNTKRLPIPAQTLIRTCKKRGNKLMFADSTGVALSGTKFLTAVLILRNLLRKYVLDPRTKEPHIGVLAPMSVGGSLLNGALSLDRRVAVNLNFTFGEEGMNYCIKQAGIKHVLTSRKVLERFPHWRLDAKIFCTEDLLEKLNLKTKIKYFLAAKFLPAWLLEWRFKLLSKEISDKLLTIVYTSGSTGQPKGVMLSNNNIAEVARGFVGAQRLSEKDSILGFLPFFHSFGLMGNFWLPILCGGQGIFHFSPLEPKKIGEMARKYPVTFMPSTPTFLRNFFRACPKEDFENLPGVVCGAEKFPIDLIDAWEKKYGIRPTEGFGATELSPVMSVNVPESRVSDNFHLYRKDGSIGRTLCNVVVKVIDLETGADLPPNEIGMIVAKGPTVMQGYYLQLDKTAEVMKDGWYVTGDVGKIDEDGFIFITGRESRISKIGGEMIPHILIEEEILKILSEDQDSEATEPLVAVTALPHPTRGEQIIVLYRDAAVNPEKIVERMRASGLPLIWIPRLDGFIKVDSIPILGTGKLDLAAVKRKATESRPNV